MVWYHEKRQIETDAQQAFRFYLKVDDLHAAYIVNVTRPSYTIATKQYTLLNHKFNHPTEITWNSISFSIREIFTDHAPKTVGGVLMHKLRDLAYDPPSEIEEDNLKNFNKSDLIKSLGNVSIEMLTPDGGVYEEWKLYGAFITRVTPSQLDYSSDALTNIDVEIIYDWAELNKR